MASAIGPQLNLVSLGQGWTNLVAHSPKVMGARSSRLDRLLEDDQI